MKLAQRRKESSLATKDGCWCASFERDRGESLRWSIEKGALVILHLTFPFSQSARFPSNACSVDESFSRHVCRILVVVERESSCLFSLYYHGNRWERAMQIYSSSIVGTTRAFFFRSCFLVNISVYIGT